MKKNIKIALIQTAVSADPEQNKSMLAQKIADCRRQCGIGGLQICTVFLPGGIHRPV